MSTKLATKSQNRNDLHWEYSHMGDDNHFEFIRWTGYDDAYWWGQVAKTQRVQACPKCGAKFELNYSTNEVKELTPKDGN